MLARRPTRKRLIRGATAIAVIFALVGAGISMRPRSLLELARPVADSSNCYGPFFWISNHEIAGPKQGDESGMTAVAFDVDTRQKRPLPDLAAALDRVKAGSNRFSSPDGRWILIDHLNGKPYYDAVSTDGIGYVRWPKPEREESHGGNIPWLADSRRWVHLVDSADGLKAVIRSVDDPLSRKELLWPNSNRGPGSGFEGISAGLHNDRVITMTIFAKGPSTIKVAWRKRDLIRGTLETLKLPNQREEEVQSVEAAPGGREIAWLVWHKQTKPDWLHRLIHLFGASDKDFMSLLVTDENVGSQREIGRVPVDVFTESSHGLVITSPAGPSALNWSPDGRRLCFQFEGKFWVLPIH